jgi:hypothetical protein
MPNLQNSKTAQRRRLEKISAYELGRPKHRLGNPNTGIGEVLVQPLYDIYAAAAATATVKLNLFSLQVGAAYNFMGVTSFNKTFNHTNLVQAGMLDSSYTFIVRGLSFYVQGLQGGTDAPYLSATDAGNLAATFSDFQVNHKSYWQGILGWLPAGGGIFTTGAGNTTAPEVNSSSVNGLPQSRNIYAVPGGIMINPQENFTVIIDPTAAAAGAWSTVALRATTVGLPASGFMGWYRLDGTLIRVA